MRWFSVRKESSSQTKPAFLTDAYETSTARTSSEPRSQSRAEPASVSFRGPWGPFRLIPQHNCAWVTIFKLRRLHAPGMDSSRRAFEQLCVKAWVLGNIMGAFSHRWFYK